MKYIYIFSSIFILCVNQISFAQKPAFDETFKVLENSLVVYHENQLVSEIDTLQSSGKNALYAEIQLVKTKVELIKTNLNKSDMYSSLKSPNSYVVVSLVYCMLVFEELDFNFVESFLNNMTSNKILDQDEKGCVLDAFNEYKVDRTSIKDFSSTENSSDLQLYFSTILGFFKGCNSN